MAITWINRIINNANFATISNALKSGIGYFRDGTYYYVVMDRSFYRMDVIRRTSEITFTDTIARLPSNCRVVINGNFFDGPTGFYVQANLGNIYRPDEIMSVGEVRQGGSVVLTDQTGNGHLWWYFGRNNAANPAYLWGGRGNPPATVHEGMGGLGPMILTNPVTGQRLRYGTGNRYASDPKKNNIPAKDDEWKDCIQRNSNGYTSLDNETASGSGFCAVGVRNNPAYLIAVIKPHNENGNLTSLRDKLWDAGCDGLIFTDGSNSVCMAIDRQMEFSPADYKNNLIEVGMGFFRYADPPIRLKVTVVSLKVTNDLSMIGSGTWSINAMANGQTLGSFTDREVNTGDVLTLNWSRQFTRDPSRGEEVNILVTGMDTAGIDENLGMINVKCSQASSPAWRIGTWIETTHAYEMTFRVDQVP